MKIQKKFLLRMATACVCILYSLLCPGLSYAQDKENTFSVLQLNLWHEGRCVPDGYQAIVDVLDELNADVVFLCEIRHTKENPFMRRVLNDLEQRGKLYYGETLGLSVGILSKNIPCKVEKCAIVPGDEGRAMLKAVINIAGQPHTFYSCHLDYKNYECYMPRGYSGATWQKIDAPIIDEATVLAANRISYRDESIRAFLEDVRAEIGAGRPVILGGDFNEPSHLDWQTDTRNLWDHNGAVINWDCSVMLTGAGFRDAFREQYPSAVTHPGFTFPAGNKVAEEAKIEKLAWAPDVDERDRIDFIYYYPAGSKLSMQKTILVGPTETVIRGKIVDNDTRDEFLTPKGIWPTDHKGNLTIFRINK